MLHRPVCGEAAGDRGGEGGGDEQPRVANAYQVGHEGDGGEVDQVDGIGGVAQPLQRRRGEESTAPLQRQGAD
ncbi:MAG: hypothetical protein ABI242_10655, partial [Caulobacteraceae bacterium]